MTVEQKESIQVFLFALGKGKPNCGGEGKETQVINLTLPLLSTLSSIIT